MVIIITNPVGSRTQKFSGPFGSIKAAEKNLVNRGWRRKRSAFWKMAGPMKIEYRAKIAQVIRRSHA